VVRVQRDRAGVELEGVPLEQRAAAHQVKAHDAAQRREALGHGVLVEPAEDHLDRDRPDVVAAEEGEQVVVGGGADRGHQVLGRRRLEQRASRGGLGGAERGQVGHPHLL
jgi:hypothetical protein